MKEKKRVCQLFVCEENEHVTGESQMWCSIYDCGPEETSKHFHCWISSAYQSTFIPHSFLLTAHEHGFEKKKKKKILQ